MKIKKTIMKLLIAIMAVILGVGTTSSFAMKDYPGDSELPLRLSLFRYANGKYTNGYAYNDGKHHPIYPSCQISHLRLHKEFLCTLPKHYFI